MATIYLRSTDGNNADDGLTWANAKATMAAAITAAGAGGTVYVSDNHAEALGSSITLSSSGTLAAPVKVLCVDDTGDPEPPTALATTALVSTTTGSLSINYSGGCTYFYGITFRPNAAGTNNAANFNMLSGAFIAEQCVFDIKSTSSSSRANFGGNITGDTQTELIQSQINFNQSSQLILIGASRFLWRGGSVGGSAAPSTLFNAAVSGRSTVVEVIGVDLSAITGTIWSEVTTPNSVDMFFSDCKLGSGVTPASAPAGVAAEVAFINSDSSDTNYRFTRYLYAAVETQETTIVRTGGANDGTTAFSRKVVTTANASPYIYYRSMPLEMWNETTGSSVTVTVATITDNVTLTDAEAWIEVEYLGTSGYPLALFVNDRTGEWQLDTPANQTTDGSSTWTTTGLTTPVKQSLSVSFTPQEKGIVRVYVCCAKASTTMYYDPLVQVT